MHGSFTLDEIESELGLTPWAVNWPIGSGDFFRGVIDRRTRQVVLFSRAERGRQSQEKQLDLDDPELINLVEPDLLAQAVEDLEFLEAAGAELDLELVHAGELTPVFFGSAMTNFGVRPFLDAFMDMAQKPVARIGTDGPVDPLRPEFSGFVFKLQANMDPRHRDRVAFVRMLGRKLPFPRPDDDLAAAQK